MTNKGNRFNSKGRDLSGPWRPSMPASAGAAQSDTPAPNSSNYRGDLRNPRNRSANVPDTENCATWWTNLPPNCTYQMLFDSMRNVGAVSHAIINPPVGVHGTSAAKVEFFDRASVDRLMEQTKNGHIRGHIRVGGRIPYIIMNRIKVAAHSRAVPNHQGIKGCGSRVLQVYGDPQIVRQGILEALLSAGPHKVIYGLEGAHTFTRPDGVQCVELRFASYTVQAARAHDIFMAQKRRADLSEAERALWQKVYCLYAVDPCE
ncbi:hypothetical protein F5Y07DRAFT_398584 [Xylaria sp. FL0933]|nr:hypothetical protein F5Y07DRAFT_398584 [Xylaria sp. FL0933]